MSIFLSQTTRISLLCALLASTLGACTWVKMAPGANSVRVLETAPSHCQKRGEVEVKTTQNLLVHQRNPVQIREELETLARNEAPGLAGNAISPLTPPVGGAQLWAVWSCASF